MTTQSPLSGPMSVGDLLDRAFRLYRARFSHFLLTAMLFLVPWTVLSGLVVKEFHADPFSPDFLGGDRGPAFATNLSVNTLLIVMKVLTAHGVATLALTVQCVQALHGDFPTLWWSIGRALRRFWPYVGMRIAAWVAMLTVTVVTVCFLTLGFGLLDFLFDGLLGELMDQLVFDETTGLFEGLGRLFLGLSSFTLLISVCLTPLFYLGARWLVAPAVLIAERLGPLASLGRSWRLSRGNVRRVTGYILLLFAILTLVIYLPATLVQWILLSLLIPSSSFGWARSISGSVSAFFSIVGIPYSIAAAVLLYYDLRIRNEGYDLELRVAEMEEQVSRNAVKELP